MRPFLRSLPGGLLDLMVGALALDEDLKRVAVDLVSLALLLRPLGTSSNLPSIKEKSVPTRAL